MAKIDKLLVKQGYDWKFSTVGGVTRVNIETGEDIAHLDELDQKLWTVLSCPVKGLEFDERTLHLLDSDGDGKLRVHEVVAAAQWLKKVLVEMEYLEEGNDMIEFSGVSDTTDEGRQVLEAARMILGKLGLDKQSIALSDVAEYMAVYEEKCKSEYVAAEGEPYEPPYGDDSDAAEAAVAAVRAKVEDWFMRCRLVQFDEDAAGALDVQVDKIAAIADNDLVQSMGEIAGYPLARPTKEGLLPLAEGINPAWQAQVAALAALPDLQDKTTLSEEEWKAIVAKVDAYTAWKAAGVSAMNEAIAAQVAEHAAAIEPVERLLRYCRDYVKLLHNYVVFKDFYRRDENNLAVFQAGKLYIDQRCCDLCIKVSDMGKSTTSAGKSGMFLIYCHCTSKGGAQMDIVAALTDGEIGGLHEGKNAIFYDRAGQDWDATITKIVDNPISIRQAFWSPYRKFGNWVTDKITKSASEKESKQFDEMTSKADTATTNLTVKTEGGAAEAKANEKKAQMFDIAKFAGIFAAIGLAIGAIGGALAALGGFVTAKWYNVVLLIAAIVVLISGPSMLLAWLKLRKRNLGPVLNANGWAINSNVKVNTAFGKTLTSMAKYPKVVTADPFADKKTPWWQKCLWWLLALVVIAFGVLYFTHNLPWQKKAASEEPVVEAVEEPVAAVEEVPAAVEAAAEEASAE